MFGGVPYTNQNPRLLPSSYIPGFKRISEGRKTLLVSNPLRLDFHTPQTQEPNLQQTLRKKTRNKKITTPNFHQPNTLPPTPKKKNKTKHPKESPSDIPPALFPRKILPSFPRPSQHPAPTRRRSTRPRWPSQPRHPGPGPWTTLRRHRRPLEKRTG